MAHSTLAVFSHPDFHTVFNQAISRQSANLFPRPQLAQLCDYEYPETREGACDGRPCYKLATEIIDGQAFCAAHEREASHG